MKVKLFVLDKSTLEALEQEVNAWLALKSGIRIVHIARSSNGGTLDTSKVFLSVWYEENR